MLCNNDVPGDPLEMQIARIPSNGTEQKYLNELISIFSSYFEWSHSYFEWSQTTHPATHVIQQARTMP